MLKLILIAWAIVGGVIYCKLYFDEKMPTKNETKNRIVYGLLGPIVWCCRLSVWGYKRLAAWLKEDDFDEDRNEEII